MQHFWRISNYESLNGEGARRGGGRWNSPGLPVVYLAETPAGAMLEALVHLPQEEFDFPDQYKLLRIEAPDGIEVESITSPNVEQMPVELEKTRSAGDLWLKEGKTPLARVPSVIMPFTWNVLLNPRHLDGQNLRIAEVVTRLYDPRLLRGTLAPRKSPQ